MVGGSEEGRSVVGGVKRGEVWWGSEEGRSVVGGGGK